MTFPHVSTLDPGTLSRLHLDCTQPTVKVSLHTILQHAAKVYILSGTQELRSPFE